MTDAPERIYTNKGATAIIPLHQTDVEWVRADVAQAMLAKAREDALREAAVICNRSYDGSIGDVHKAIHALIDKTEGDA